MNFDWTAEELAFAAAVRRFLSDNLPGSLTADLQEGEAKEKEVWTQEGRDFEHKMFEKGWAVLDLPPEYGQPSLNAMQRYLLLCELDYSNAPKFTRATTVSVIPTLARMGTDENKAMWMDKLAAADVTISIGYSEPSAGSDLAALRTTARLDGDEWVINGQKTWNSRGSTSSHIWLLARTGEPGGRHKGLSMFIVPLNAPGVQINDIRSWGDHAFADVFFSDVRVPASHVIGQVGNGWAMAMGAVGGERMFGGFANGLRKIFDELLEYCRTNSFEGEVLATRPEVAMGLTRLAVDIELADLISLDICSRVDAGEQPDSEALGLKIFTSELRTRIADFAMQVLGIPGLLTFKEATAPVNGDMELLYRRSPPARLGMGANEILRDVIAQRGLGLPRG
ncbi:MAG: acyl-CoA dehydrogenase family protein [Steroidobacteraceae bacterium]